jgi:beta-lactamase superfamily II metal-dependent hydrolase
MRSFILGFVTGVTWLQTTAALPTNRLMAACTATTLLLLACASALRQPAARSAAGQGWTWDGVRFEMLGPATGSYEGAGLMANARSACCA